MSVEKDQLTEILLNVEPNAKLVRQWQMGGGISCTMTGIEIERPNGEFHTIVVRKVGKWSLDNYPNSVRNEFELLRYLSECGIPVARPLHYDLTCVILDRPFLVLDYVDGSPDLITKDRAKRVTIMADHLAKIHSINLKHSALGFMKPSPINIRPPGESLNEELRESEIRSVLTGALPKVVENQYAFRHGDFWPGNMIWKDGELAAVIDWEETSIGDPLFDVAIARLDILWAYGEESMNLFIEQYQLKMDINFEFLSWWDLRVSLRPISNITEWATAFPKLGRPDVTVETMKERHLWFVDQAIELLQRD